MLAGWLIVAIITPLSQFLTIRATNAAIETDTPAGWVVGLIISIVLAGLVVRLLARRQAFGRANLALLYGMLALAVPLMNIGLVRQFLLASHTVVREYLYEGNSTYRTSYNALNDRWFPVVPTREGLVWSRSERVLRLLEDPAARQRQAVARRQLESALAAGSIETPDPAALAGLALDDAAAFLSRTPPEQLQALGLLVPLQVLVGDLSARSAAARDLLAARLNARDEWAVSLLASNQQAMGYSNHERLMAETDRLAEAERDALARRTQELEAVEPQLRAAAAAIGEGDRQALLSGLRADDRGHVGALSRGEFLLERNRYVIRLDRDERRSILRMNGTNGPNQNLFAFMKGLWNTPQEKAVMEAMSLPERFAVVVKSIPWLIYLRPLAAWALLFTAIYAFLMCLAEWLRRKWVSRENLPFPLVEVADYVIRHDHALETAGDLTRPARRPVLFNPLFLAGCAIGFLMLLAQGAGHYGFIGGDAIIMFDFSKNIFDVMGGALKNLPATVFVLSPIVVGIVFLLSLEVGFSIWFSFILYGLVVFAVKAANPTLTDGNWTGWADGKLYPFTMEQMLGAVACFAVYHLWKVRSHGKGHMDPAECYVPDRITRWGLVVLPLLIGLALWDIGLQDLPVLLMFALAVLAITVAVARVRAETGFPGGHAIFEFTKLPIIFGMTGAMGAKVYAAFLNIVFLPTTLLFRTLPQQLENMELARRHRIGFRPVALGGLSAMLMAMLAGFFCFLVFSFGIGDEFYGFSVLPPLTSGEGALQVATYPLWVGHFLGEPGLDRFTAVNWYRMAAIAGGFGAVGILLLLRSRFMRFPLHPVGYLVFLTTILYSYETPYLRVPELKPLLSSAIWGSALVAWLLKRLVVKYGGMNVYKQAKPLFVGLVVGSVGAVFAWNMLDLAVSLYAVRDVAASDFVRRFTETIPFTPAFF